MVSEARAQILYFPTERFGRLCNVTRDLATFRNCRKKSESLSLKSVCDMGRLSKAAQARLNNLSKASSKPCRATVEDAPESDSECDSDYFPGTGCEGGEEHGGYGGNRGARCEEGRFFILEDDGISDSDSDTDSESEDLDWDEEEEAEVKNDATLLTFTETLQKAQVAAAKAERERRESRKRSRAYTGNSSRSIRRHAETRRKLASGGQQRFIQSFFLPRQQRDVEVVSTVHPHEEDSESDTDFEPEDTINTLHVSGTIL
jgi:flagellum-specific peptidoglycan hydrolase FlgJ